MQAGAVELQQRSATPQKSCSASCRSSYVRSAEWCGPSRHHGCRSELHSQGAACLVDIHVLVQVEGHLPSTCTSAGSDFVVCYLYLLLAQCPPDMPKPRAGNTPNKSRCLCWCGGSCLQRDLPRTYLLYKVRLKLTGYCMQGQAGDYTTHAIATPSACIVPLARCSQLAPGVLLATDQSFSGRTAQYHWYTVHTSVRKYNCPSSTTTAHAHPVTDIHTLGVVRETKKGRRGCGHALSVTTQQGRHAQERHERAHILILVAQGSPHTHCWRVVRVPYQDVQAVGNHLRVTTVRLPVRSMVCFCMR